MYTLRVTAGSTDSAVTFSGKNVTDGLCTCDASWWSSCFDQEWL